METEKFVSGYCRQLDGSRMVEVVLPPETCHHFLIFYSVAALAFVGLKEYPCFFMQWK